MLSFVKQVEPIGRFVCLLQGNRHLVDEVRPALSVFCLPYKGTDGSTRAEQLPRKNEFIVPPEHFA